MVLRRHAAIVAVPALAMAVACAGSPVLDPSPTASSEQPSLAPSRLPSPTASVDYPTSEDPSAAGPDPGTDEGPTAGSEPQFVADLDAGSVPDGAGDGRATGEFEAHLTPLEATARLCYELAVEGLASEAVEARLVWDDPSGDETVVTSLTPPEGTQGRIEDCVVIDGGDSVSLFQHPDQHYVLVTTRQHPDGAIQGWLREG